MSKKAKIIPVIITSREAMESTVGDLVQRKIDYARAEAEMAKEIAAVQQRHMEKMLTIAKQIEIMEAGVYIYCAVNRAELFADKKSIDTLLATIGFRTHPHSVEKKGSKTTWDAIVTRLQNVPWGEAYVRDPAPQVNKDALLNDREKLTANQLATIGIYFDQEETFYIKPKTEVAEETKVAA